jgi:DNA-binding MarR family transcriptional regulator
MWGWEPAEWGSKKAAVGESEYNLAYSTLSRSLDRLWRRNLIVYWKTLSRYRTAVSLTDEGKVLAQAIFAEGQNEQFNG